MCLKRNCCSVPVLHIKKFIPNDLSDFLVAQARPANFKESESQAYIPKMLKEET